MYMYVIILHVMYVIQLLSIHATCPYKSQSIYPQIKPPSETYKNLYFKMETFISPKKNLY